MWYLVYFISFKETIRETKSNNIHVYHLKSILQAADELTIVEILAGS